MKDLELESAVASALATSCRILPKGVIATPENFKARIKVLSALGFGITDGTLQLDGAFSIIDEVKTQEGRKYALPCVTQKLHPLP